MSRTLNLLGHPLHAMSTHFPMAFLTGCICADIVAFLTGDPLWWAIGFWLAIAGIATGLFSATAGIVDLSNLPKGPEATTAVRHMVTMVVALAVFGGSAALRHRVGAPGGALTWAVIGLDAAGALLLGLGGWLGGHLVFHHGIGVEGVAVADKSRER
jgi:uncharacterized membrane protein